MRECPALSTKQQEQMHMIVEQDEEEEEHQQFFHYSMMQGDKLPNSWAYLDWCLMVTAFKTKKYLDNIRRVSQGFKINCNSGSMRTIQVGDYQTLKVWYISEEIANIFSINKLEKKYHITYNSWDGYYNVHTASGEVQFYKDENGLPYTELEQSLEHAAALLVQKGSEEATTVFVQMVQQNYKGFTKARSCRPRRQEAQWE